VRVGMRLGPFYVSTSTRRRRRRRSSSSAGGGGRTLLTIFGVLLLIGWPLALGQMHGGGYHPWWLIAVPWWVFLALIALGSVASKDAKRSPGAAGSSKDHP
jgi:cytochrome bd-type quinol oxidase subunit 2